MRRNYCPRYQLAVARGTEQQSQQNSPVRSKHQCHQTGEDRPLLSKQKLPPRGKDSPPSAAGVLARELQRGERASETAGLHTPHSLHPAVGPWCSFSKTPFRNGERVTRAERGPGPGCYPHLAGGRFPPAFLQQQAAMPLAPVPLAAWLLICSAAFGREHVCPLPAVPTAEVQAQRHSQYSRSPGEPRWGLCPAVGFRQAAVHHSAC